MSIYDFCPKHLFFLILCKSHYPHIICVDNVDKFVYNCVSKGFPLFSNVDNSSFLLCAHRQSSTFFVHIVKIKISYDKITLNTFRLL